MSGFNLQIGMDSDSNDAGTADLDCEKCGEATTHQLTMKTRRFRVFGISLGKGTSSTSAKCATCGEKRSA